MATAVLTEGSGRRAALAAFERALARELPSLAAVDLGPLPTFVWQQLHNQLQQDPAAPATLLAAERRRRSTPQSAPWLRLICGEREALATRTFGEQGASVRACRWAARGDLVVSLAGDDVALTGTATVWSAADGHELARFRNVLAVLGGGDAVLMAELTGEDERADRALRLYDARSGRRLAALTHLPSLPITCALADDGRTLFLSDAEEAASIWDLPSERLVHELPGAYGYEQAAAWTADGQFVVLSATSDRLDKSWVQIYEAAGGKLVYRFREDLSGALVPLPFAISPDGRHVAHAAQVEAEGAAGAAGPRVVVWSTRERRATACCAGFTGAVRHCAFSPDGRLLACSAEEPAVRLFDSVTGTQVALVDSGSIGHRLAWSPDGRLLAVACDDLSIRVWDVARSRETARLNGPASQVTALAFSPDDSLLLGAEVHGRLTIWPAPSAESAAASRTLNEPAAVTEMAFSADGGRLLFGDAAGRLGVRDTASGQTTWLSPGHDAAISVCAFSPRGGALLTASEDGVMRLWDAVGAATPRTLCGHEAGVTVCAFSLDGTLIASGDQAGFVLLTDARSGAELATYSDHIDCPMPAVTALAFSPNGVLLASAANNRSGNILVRNALTGDVLATLAGSPPRTTALAISGDDRYLVSGSSSGHVRLWGLRTAVELATLRGRNAGAPAVARCAFSREERFIVCRDRFGHVTAWDKATARAVAAAAAWPAPYDLSSDRATRFELSLAGGAEPIAVWPTAAEPQRAEIGPTGTTIAVLDWSGSLSVLRICGGPAGGSN